ncbi:MAG: tyrosine-type recombinase/integrase [Pseudomonadota bacterium]
MLDDIRQRYGQGRIADLRADHIRKDLDRFTGHAANNRLRAWRGLCAWATDAGLFPRDPSDGLKRKKTAKSEGHIPWTADEVAAFRARWPVGSVDRLAFELIHWTGARVSDVVKLGEGHVDRDGFLAFRQTKTGGDVFVPLRCELPEFAEGMAGDLDLLHAALEARGERRPTFLTTAGGEARSVKAFSQWFAAKARAAGIRGKSAHGLRKTRAIALVEAGAKPHQVGAWTGHESLKEIERYAKRYDRKRVLTRAGPDRKVPTQPGKVPTSEKNIKENKEVTDRWRPRQDSNLRPAA